MTGASSAFHPLNQLVLSVNHSESFSYQHSKRSVQVPPIYLSQPIRARRRRSLQRLYKQGLKHVASLQITNFAGGRIVKYKAQHLAIQLKSEVP